MTEGREKLSDSPEWVAITLYAEAMERVRDLEAWVTKYGYVKKLGTGADDWDYLPITKEMLTRAALGGAGEG